MGHCSRNPGAQMLTLPRIKALPTADSCIAAEIVLLWGAGRCGTRRSLLRSQHHHKRARLHPTVEIDHILIGQPDAARRDRMSDPSGLVRAVDAIERVLPVGIKVEGAGAHWIGGAAFDIVRKRS